jgi:histidine ammonia-lyase
MVRSNRQPYPRAWSDLNCLFPGEGSASGSHSPFPEAFVAITLNGSQLTLSQLVRIARHNEPVALSPDSLDRIITCRAMLEKKIMAREIMYGVNTGIGEFSEVVLTDEQVQQFQRYLICNHAAGIGEPMPIEAVRAAMAGRINVHAHGNSGCRPEITQTFVEMLNKGVTPVVCRKGSVGACGDLAPMFQIALLMMGEGEAFYQGQRMPLPGPWRWPGFPSPASRPGTAWPPSTGPTYGRP